MTFSTSSAPTSSGEARVQGGGHSAESGTIHRPTSSFEERQHLSRDIVARLSHAIEFLDSLIGRRLFL